MTAPNRRTERDRLHEAIHQLGPDPFDVELRPISSHDQAVAGGFHGSLSFLVNGRDPFTDPDAPVGLACRVYPTPDGLAAAPIVEQLARVLKRALAG